MVVFGLMGSEKEGMVVGREKHNGIMADFIACPPTVRDVWISVVKMEDVGVEGDVSVLLNGWRKRSIGKNEVSGIRGPCVSLFL